jgi:hypothetical protein
MLGSNETKLKFAERVLMGIIYEGMFLSSKFGST